MARITVVSMAFWGDVMPFVPIANNLADRGHEVTFAVPEGFHDMLANERFALATAGVQFSPRELAAHGDIVAGARSGVGAARAGRFWVGEFGVKPIASIHRAIMAATADADLLLTHPTAGFVARMSAELRGIPWVTGHLFPMMLPSRHHLPGAYPFRRADREPSPGHAAKAWKAVESVAAHTMYDRQINSFRASLGLAPVRANALYGGVSPTDVLLLSSPSYTPVFDDWPEHYRATGFTIWAGPTGRPMPESLAAHLAAGDPPVLVTLGTSAAANGDRLLARIAEVLDRAHLRAVFLVGDAAQHSADLVGRGDAWAFAPLPEVLRHCRAVVHAGGHGTTAAVLAAGLPSVVLPQIFDQAWHGDRVASLGVGVTLPHWARRPYEIEGAVRRIVGSPKFGAAARALAAQLATEDGVGNACDAIEARLRATAGRSRVGADDTGGSTPSTGRA